MNVTDKSNHEQYIQRCFDIAIRSGKHVKSNPYVGSVIVYNDRIIGEGAHEYFGQAHAEVNAFQSVKADDKKYLDRATIYVSLEPCNHTGKTGPCAQAILDHGVPRVVISAVDPDPRVSGQSIQFLKDHGVSVTQGILESEGLSLIRPFIINQQENRPYVVIKYAQSADHIMAKTDESVWISNEYSKVLTHQWRSEVDAILIGVNTLLVDNPSLTTRLVQGDHPQPIIIDPSLRSDISLNLFQTELRPIIFTASDSSIDGADTINIDFDHQPIEQVLQYLYQEKHICRLMVEGGRKTIDGFIKAALWDEARIFTSSTRLSEGIKAPTIQGKSLHTTFIDNDRLDVLINESESHT